MNFRGSAFSTGKSRVEDAVQSGGRVSFLQKNGAAFMHRVLDTDKKAFEMVDSEVSYANSCWFYAGGILELYGPRFAVKE